MSVSNYNSNRILFCYLAYMKTYSGAENDVPFNGGSYVKENGTAFERTNFKEREDGYYYGFVEPGRVGDRTHQIHIENIDAAARNTSELDNVLVVFCASPGRNNTIVIGWYRNATVYRDMQPSGETFYNLRCRIDDGRLLDEEYRRFPVPWARNSAYGFGRHHLWYAQSRNDNAKAIADFKKDLLEYIDKVDSSTEADLEDLKSNVFFEDGTGKVHQSRHYERNPAARAECLSHYGYKCHVCGFESEKTYGPLFKNKIEVHHIVPISERGKVYELDPVKDLVPICPNCHTMLHTKLEGGGYPTISQLMELVGKKNRT